MALTKQQARHFQVEKALKLKWQLVLQLVRLVFHR